ncbi:MAG: VTT domain-containing protein [Actinomycetes bacterium]
MPLHVASALAVSLFDPEGLISSFGLIGILVIVFAECGLLIGFFLPGDSLLFAAGLLTAGGVLDYPIALVCLLIAIAAIAGNLTGYWVGRSVGPMVLDRPDGRLFRRAYVTQTRSFFDRYGPRAIFLARFVPIVRTLITVMAGVVRMDFRTFAFFTVIGGLVWGIGVTLLGYYLGNVPIIKEHLELFLLGFVALSIVPILYELRRGRRAE